MAQRLNQVLSNISHKAHLYLPADSNTSFTNSDDLNKPTPTLKNTME